ncbi:MAG: hypothetical protein QXG00_08085 [Candidatus Woesearchaeota archaeon]
MVLWSTKKCKEYSQSINEFENCHYPSEFKATVEEFIHWLNSDVFFCNAIVEDGKILSIISFLITDLDSYQRIVSNQITEKEILPFNNSLIPSLYFSSFIISKDMHAFILTKNIFKEMRNYINNIPLKFNHSFSISATKDGENFLKKNGYNYISDYKIKYPIYYLDELHKSILKYL